LTRIKRADEANDKPVLCSDVQRNPLSVTACEAPKLNLPRDCRYDDAPEKKFQEKCEIDKYFCNSGARH
jgi:hypothetical protein